MSKMLSIHFNAQSEIASAAIDGLLLKPDAIKPMLALPLERLLAQTSPTELAAATSACAGLSTEAAARHHLQTLLVNQDSEKLAEITSPERPEAMPDMRLERNEEMPLTGTQSVVFQQTAHSLPIFGTRAVVEIDAESRRLSTVDGMITFIPDISALPTLSVKETVEKLAAALKKSTAALEVTAPPALCFYPQPVDEAEPGREQEITWKLAYHFVKLPVPPPEAEEGAGRDCCGQAFTPFGPVPHDYLVDANSGELLFFYPSAVFLDIPIACTGKDVDGNDVMFDGLQINATTFELTDPLRDIQTLDANFADIAHNSSAGAQVRHQSASFPASVAAATTAHAFSTRVFDFFNHVLKRKGVDNKGMKLVSIVNCYYSSQNHLPFPGWANAMWYQGKMWYGSTLDAAGNNAVTTARFLDVMAHELAHGVTETTANLIYRNQSGALNESFSDIFGIFIKNWYPGEPNPLSGWTWSLGDGWDGPGTVLRDCEDPTLGGSFLYPNGPGQPNHMNNYYRGTGDYGGVHVNSGIHNRAFYNVMKSVDAQGSPLFSPDEVALLYYVTLTRLAPMSQFSDCRRTLLNVTTQRYQGQPAAQQAKLNAIRAAYNAVGIV